MQQPLENFERVFVALELEQDLGRGREVLDGVVDVLHPRVGFGQAQMREGIGGVELDDLAGKLRPRARPGPVRCSCVATSS